MSMKCELTGKTFQPGNNVSHAKNRTKRRFMPNLQSISFMSEEGKLRIPDFCCYFSPLIKAVSKLYAYNI